MKSNQLIICFIIAFCFSISGLFSESSKSVILKDLEKIKQHAQLKERAKQTKEFKKRIDHQKKFSIRNKVNTRQLFSIGTSNIQSALNFTSRSDSYENTISVLLNGLESATVNQFDSVKITINFSSGVDTAKVQFGIDMDGNGVWEEDIDHLLFDGEMIVDDDDDDENPEDGIWELTWEKEDGPQNFQNIGFFLLVTDAGGSDIAYLKVEPILTEYSISGQIIDDNGNSVAIPNFIIEAILISDDYGMGYGVCVT